MLTGLPDSKIEDFKLEKYLEINDLENLNSENLEV